MKKDTLELMTVWLALFLCAQGSWGQEPKAHKYLLVDAAKLPLDRFAGLRAADKPGTIVMKPISSNLR